MMNQTDYYFTFTADQKLDISSQIQFAKKDVHNGTQIVQDNL